MRQRGPVGEVNRGPVVDEVNWGPVGEVIRGPVCEVNRRPVVDKVNRDQ